MLEVMSWIQIFERARKTGTFNEDDYEKAKSWPHCAVGDMICSIGYNKSYTSRQLAAIIVHLDNNLADMGCAFTAAIAKSEYMSECKQDYSSDDEYRKECMKLVNKAQEIYDMIQKTEPSQALIDFLVLKATPATA